MTLPLSKVIPGLKRFRLVSDEVALGSIARTKLAEDALVKHGVPLAITRQPTGIPHDATGGAGLFAVNVASNVQTLQGQAADSNTKTSVCNFQFALPDNYLGGAIKVRIATKLKSVTGTGVTNNGSDVDCSAYKQASGAVGSDLVSTSVQTYAAIDTWYSKDFVVDETGLVAGDVLNVVVTARAIESNAGNGTLSSYIGELNMLVDVQG